MDVDAEEALEEALSEYERRMSVNIMIEKGQANKKAGGYDNKEEN